MCDSRRREFQVEDATCAKALKLECACDSPNLGGGGKLFCNIVHSGAHCRIRTRASTRVGHARCLRCQV